MAFQTKEFTLNGEKVVATELNLGQFKKVQKAVESVGEVEAGTLMVALALGKKPEELDELPISSTQEISAISTWLSDILLAQ